MRLLLLSLILCGSVGALFGQWDRLPQFSLGGRVDYALHQVDFSPVVSQQALAGQGVYASLWYFDLAHVGFIGELGVARAGWEEGTGGDDRYIRRLTFGELLILTQVNIGRGRFRPILQAGPYVAFPIQDEEEIGQDFVVPEGRYYGVQLPSRLNYGLRGGLGLHVNLSKVQLQLHGFVLQGLSDLIPSGELGVSVSRRQGVGGSISFRFRLF